MASAPRPLIAGNWKMNGLQRSSAELAGVIAGAGKVSALADLMICPPATLLAAFATMARGSPVAIGAQDCHADPSGAFTGDIAAEMLKDAGASAVIVGHSERRMLHKETDRDVRSKAMAAWRAGLTAIICVGETQSQRDAGETMAIIRGQLDGSVPDGAGAGTAIIAYEPIWAIGTGVTPTPADVADVHRFIRQWLENRVGEAGQMRILYGGSVKPSNAHELMGIENVNGALVGGASLKAAEFLAIADAYAPPLPSGSGSR